MSRKVRRSRLEKDLWNIIVIEKVQVKGFIKINKLERIHKDLSSQTHVQKLRNLGK